MRTSTPTTRSRLAREMHSHRASPDLDLDLVLDPNLARDLVLDLALRDRVPAASQALADRCRVQSAGEAYDYVTYMHRIKMRPTCFSQQEVVCGALHGVEIRGRARR